MYGVSEEDCLLRLVHVDCGCFSFLFAKECIKRSRWQADAMCSNCRGQLASDEVQLLLWQMLHVLKYLHANHVWHRDLKSAYVLVKLEGGQRIIKVLGMAIPVLDAVTSPWQYALTALSGLSILLCGPANQTDTRYYS